MTSAPRELSRSTILSASWRGARCRGRSRCADGNGVTHPGMQARRAGQTLHLADHRRLGTARSETGAVHHQARGRFGGDLLVVLLCLSAVLRYSWACERLATLAKNPTFAKAPRFAIWIAVTFVREWLRSGFGSCRQRWRWRGNGRAILCFARPIPGASSARRLRGRGRLLLALDE